MTALVALYRLLLRQQVTAGRLALVGGFSALCIAVALGISQQGDDLIEATVQFSAVFGLSLMVPIVALVISSSTLGELVDDETIVYLWHRPSPRWKLALAAWAAAATVAIPLTSIPLAVAALIGSSDGGTAGSVAYASALAALAYSGLFVLLGLLLRRALIWGLVYLFIWELFVANVGGGSARLSVRTYPLSVLSQLTDVEIRLADYSTTTGTVVPVTIALVAVWLTAWRLNHIDVA
jgi:ABC-2 type transport system permease protein